MTQPTGVHREDRVTFKLNDNIHEQRNRMLVEVVTRFCLFILASQLLGVSYINEALEEPQSSDESETQHSLLTKSSIMHLA